MTDVPDLFHAPEPQPEPTDLVKVDEREIGGVMQMTADGRELHSFLGVGKVFGAWVKDRISKYAFVEGKDFSVNSNFGKNPDGGRPTKEYRLSLDMAKAIAMVENNEKGRQVRRYFLDCERKVLEATRHAATGDVGALFDLFSEDGQTVRKMLEGLKGQQANIAYNLKQDIEGLKPALMGYEKKNVIPALASIGESLAVLTQELIKLQNWNVRREKAKYERDCRILARAERSDTATMRDALELMQVPEEHRTPELSAYLTRQSAAVWFADRGYRYLPSGGESNRLAAEFELRRIPDWWEAKGKSAYDRFFAKKGRRTVIRLATDEGKTVAQD